jgi:hypothetical protein
VRPRGGNSLSAYQSSAVVRHFAKNPDAAGERHQFHRVGRDGNSDTTRFVSHRVSRGRLRFLAMRQSPVPVGY